MPVSTLSRRDLRFALDLLPEWSEVAEEDPYVLVIIDDEYRVLIGPDDDRLEDCTLWPGDDWELLLTEDGYLGRDGRAMRPLNGFALFHFGRVTD